MLIFSLVAAPQVGGGGLGPPRNFLSWKQTFEFWKELVMFHTNDDTN